MSLNEPRFKADPAPIRLYDATAKLGRLQGDLVSEAVRRAVDDVSAAITHQLSEPLTALLLYLHEIKRAGEHLDGTALVPLADGEIVDNALREADRVCAIMERLGQAVDTPIDSETAIARGREAINAWTQKVHSVGIDNASQAYGSHPILTPREHEVLALITGGASNKEGGHRLGISTRTFEVHRAHLMRKLGARNAADLVRIVLSNDQ